MPRRINRDERVLIDRLRAWAEAYPPYFSVFAMQAAYAAPSLTEALLLAEQWEEHPDVLPRYEAERFYAYYESRGELLADLWRTCEPESSISAEFVEKMITRLPRRAGKFFKRSVRTGSREELHEGYVLGRRLARVAVAKATKRLVLGEEQSDDASDQFWERIVTSAAGAYVLRVAAPYWVRFGVWPWDAFRLAVNSERPDLRRLRELVRVDPKVLHHPALSATLHPRSPMLERSRWAEVAKAIGSQVEAPTLSVVKRRVASLISQISMRFLPKRIPPRRITELFDLVARCRDPISDKPRLHVLSDADLPVGDDLRSAIKHYSGHFDLPPKPDKEYFESVRKVTAWLAYDPRHGRAA